MPLTKFVLWVIKNLVESLVLFYHLDFFSLKLVPFERGRSKGEMVERAVAVVRLSPRGVFEGHSPRRSDLHVGPFPSTGWGAAPRNKSRSRLLPVLPCTAAEGRTATRPRRNTTAEAGRRRCANWQCPRRLGGVLFGRGAVFCRQAGPRASLGRRPRRGPSLQL